MNLPAWPAAATSSAPHFASVPAPAWPPADTGFNLPDGTPLLLTISRKSLYVQLTQSVTIAQPDEALLLLYLCSPAFDPRSLWRTPAPSDDLPDPDMQQSQPDRFTAIRCAAEAWADATFHHTQMMSLWELALSLWNDSHATATAPMDPDPAEAGEKKSIPAPSPTGVSNTSASSPEATSPSETASSTPFPCGTPTPPSTLGPSSRDSLSSPPPSNPPASPAPTPSSPPPSPVNPDDGQPFWVSEIIGRHPLLYATGRQTAASGDQVTADIHEAMHFPTREAALEWIQHSTRPAAWVPRDHMCLDAPGA